MDQVAMDVGGPTLDDSAARAYAKLRTQLGRRLEDLCGGVWSTERHGVGLPERARRAVTELLDGDKGWPQFVVRDGSGATVAVRVVSAKETNARRTPRLWTQEGPAWERLVALDRELAWPDPNVDPLPDRVVLAFDDDRAIAVRDMRRGVHWERSDHGANPHVAIMDRDRRPLAEVLA